MYAAPGTFTATVLVTDQTGETTMTEVTELVVGTEPTRTPTLTPTPTESVTPTGGTPTPASTPVTAKNACDAAKIACAKTKLGCLLKEHARAEGKGEAPAPAALQRCADAFAGCVGKVESKQKPEKPQTVCSVTGDTATLQAGIDAFVAGVVTAIHPSFPSVAPPSSCDAGKKKCVTQHASCLLSARGKAAKSGAAPDTAKLSACDDKLDGGTKGYARGCIGKLESKQKALKPKTVCSVTTDLVALQQQVDAFIDDLVAAIQGIP